MRHSVWFLTAIVCLMTVVSSSPGEEVKVPTLDLLIKNERPIDGAPLKDVLEHLANRHQLKFVTDHAAFRRAGSKDPGETPVKVPKFVRVRLDIALTLTLRQAGATYKMSEKGEIVLVPDTRRLSLASVLPKASDDGRKALAKIVISGKQIDGAPLKDVLEFLSDRTEVTILVDVAGFRHIDRKKDVEESQVKLGVGVLTLEQFLTELAKQVKGRVIASDSLILLVPDSWDA